MLLFFCNGGGTSKYDLAAKKAGWLLGINSGANNLPKERVYMIDNNWKNYNHKRHVMLCQEYKPIIATIKDLEDKEAIFKSLEGSLDFLPFVKKVMVIPKVYSAKEINNFLSVWGLEDRYILGFPVGRYSHLACLQTFKELKNVPVHLLGGSPNKQAKAYDFFNKDKVDRVFSIDSNYSQRVAQYGKVIYQNFQGKPSADMVTSGIDFNYRCLEFSLKKQREYWQNIQTRLI